MSVPLTPFHLGPALLFGLLLFSYIDFPTFLLANIIVDLEPFLVLSLNLHYPLHGFFHSFLGVTLLALFLAAAMSKMRNAFSPLLASLKLEQQPSFRSILPASLLGVYAHILLDSPLYSDMRPFYPLDLNPLLGVFTVTEVYTLCTLFFLGGGIMYAIRLVVRRRTTRNTSAQLFGVG